jgi:hypothetical protein
MKMATAKRQHELEHIRDFCIRRYGVTPHVEILSGIVADIQKQQSRKQTYESMVGSLDKLSPSQLQDLEIRAQAKLNSYYKSNLAA